MTNENKESKLEKETSFGSMFKISLLTMLLSGVISTTGALGYKKALNERCAEAQNYQSQSTKIEQCQYPKTPKEIGYFALTSLGLVGFIGGAFCAMKSTELKD